MIVWKKPGADIIQEMKEHGYSSARIRKEKAMNENALQYLRKDRFTLAALDAVCRITRTQPGKWIAWKPDETPPAAADAPEAGPAE